MSHRGSLVVAVGSQIAPADLPALCAGVRSRLERSRAEVVVLDLGAVVAPDAVTIDAMARLALVARRLGRRVQLRAVPDALQELLAFTGICDALAETRKLPLVLQGQTEEREDAFDVEEEAELDDPTA